MWGRSASKGLGAFTSVLATISADNVAPMALIQMEALGAVLFINGEFAEKVKTLLQRCSDIRLDKLAVLVGCRKNDSASLMAQSAGGQAVALLSMYLTSLFKRADIGNIFSRVSLRLLSGSLNVSSAAQLTDVAELLSAKLEVLGFGNLLARETTKIYQVHGALGKSAPKDLLEPIDVDSACELLESLVRHSVKIRKSVESAEV